MTQSSAMTCPDHSKAHWSGSIWEPVRNQALHCLRARVTHPKILGYLKPKNMSKFWVRVPVLFHIPTHPQFLSKRRNSPETRPFFRVGTGGWFGCLGHTRTSTSTPDLSHSVGTSTKSSARASPEPRHCPISIGDLTRRRNQYKTWRHGFPRSRL